MTFKSGYSAIQDHISKGNSSNNSNFVSLLNIYWKDDGESKIIRHLHDDPASIGMHEFTLCADGKKRDFVCRGSLVEFNNGELKPNPQACPICKSTVTDEKGTRLIRPNQKALGLVAIRATDIVNGRRVITDVMRDVDIFDENKNKLTVTVPTVGIIKQSLSNFWNNFANFYIRYGTTMDRDYEVVRSGKGGQGQGNTVTYTPMPEDPIQGLRSPEDVQLHYKEALRNSSPQELLVDWINFRGSEKYMTKFLPEEVLAKVGWSAQEQINNEAPQSFNTDNLDGHPGGLDEFKSPELEQLRQQLESKYGKQAN